jgi:hypothetical protein
MVISEKGFMMRDDRPRARAGEPLHHQVLADVGLSDDQVVDVQVVVVLGVADGAVERLCERRRRCAWG